MMRAVVWLPLVFVPLVAWSKDATVVVLVLGAAFVLADPAARRAASDLTSLRTLPGAAALAFIGWSLASLAWASQGAWVDWLKGVSVVVAGWCLTRGLIGLGPDQLKVVTRGLVYAVTALFTLLLTERVSDGGLIGQLRPGQPTLRLFDELSAGLAFLCCLVFATARLMALQGAPGRGAGLIVAVLLLALSYNMDAAPFAVAAGMAVYMLTIVGGARGYFVACGVLLAAALLWGEVAIGAKTGDVQAWLTTTFGPNWGLRVDYWARVAELSFQHPVLGHGFEAGRVLGRSALSPETAAAVPFMHPHNGMLQIRLELGLVGVALIAVLFTSAAYRAALMLASRASLATVGATIFAVSVFWLVSFDAWSGWWMAALALVVASLILVVRADHQA